MSELQISQVLGFNPIALRTAKTLWSFGRSECNRVNEKVLKAQMGEKKKLCLKLSTIAFFLMKQWDIRVTAAFD